MAVAVSARMRSRSCPVHTPPFPAINPTQTPNVSSAEWLRHVKRTTTDQPVTWVLVYRFVSVKSWVWFACFFVFYLFSILFRKQSIMTILSHWIYFWLFGVAPSFSRFCCCHGILVYLCRWNHYTTLLHNYCINTIVLIFYVVVVLLWRHRGCSARWRHALSSSAPSPIAISVCDWLKM